MPDGTEQRDTYHTTYQPWEDFYVYGPGVFTQPAAATADDSNDAASTDDGADGDD
jgi:hypothetical protein